MAVNRPPELKGVIVQIVHSRELKSYISNLEFKTFRIK